jgi:pimeloyl-ACP methyl ester carboxylesterase
MRIRLRDGRHIGVEEHGAGVPFVWLPGTPGSRVWKAPFVPDGVRLIVVERPGFGESDSLPKRRYLDWPDDLAQVADQLGIGDFVLAGTSGAGPYLHVCGVRIAERIRRLGVIACMGPPEISTGMPYWRRATLALARIAPRLVKASLPRNPEMFYRMLTRDAPPCDRAIIERIWKTQVAMTAEATTAGKRWSTPCSLEGTSERRRVAHQRASKVADYLSRRNRAPTKSGSYSSGHR